MNEKVQHVVALPADLKANLDPIQLGGLEEFGGLEGPEEVSLSLSLGRTVMQGVQHVVLQKFLVAHPNLVNNTSITTFNKLKKFHSVFFQFGCPRFGMFRAIVLWVQSNQSPGLNPVTCFVTLLQLIGSRYVW